MQFSESAVYRHFKSKEEIIVALLEYLAENINERLSRVIADEPNPMLCFRAIFANQFRFFQKHPYFVVAVFSDGLLEESQKINATILKIMQVKMKHLLPVLMQGQQQGFLSHTIKTADM